MSAPSTAYDAEGRFERALRAGRFVVTAELNPPDSADPDDVFDRAMVLSQVCDAINATDASGANCHMSSLGICALLRRAGYATIMQISCRDRNRIAIQGDVLGAAAMGVRNILCLSGDSVAVGDHPEAKPVFDLDSITLLETIRGMCEEGRFLSGREITALPRVFRGAAANPFVPPFEQRPLRLAKKIAAGAQFVQTQYCYDAPVLERYMASVRELGLHEKCYIIPGVGPLTSASAARWIRSKVPGVHIPDAVISRLESASDQKAEGRRICIELIQQISEIAGVAGIHMMAYRQEEAVTEIVMESGILARRRPKRARSAVKAG